MDGLLGAVLGGSVYALWVFFVNWHNGSGFALKVAIVHWSLSTFLTYYGTAVMRYCYRVFKGIDKVKLFSAFVGGMVFTYGLLVPVHILMGTPNIPLSLAAGIIPTILFCISYSILLCKTE